MHLKLNHINGEESWLKITWNLGGLISLVKTKTTGLIIGDRKIVYKIVYI